MLGRLTTLVIALIFSTLVSAGEQVISPTPFSQVAAPNKNVSFKVKYSTRNPIDNSLTGLGLRLHWNTSILTFSSLTQTFATNLIAQGSPENDISNFDNDSTTDKFINMSWVDFSGNWPGVSLANLYTANFITATNFIGQTSVNFSSSSTASGFTLSPTSATMSASETVIEPPSPSMPASLIYYIMSTSLKN